MEIKKSKKADLEGQKSTSLLLGYIFGLGLLLAAFEWTTRTYEEVGPVVVYASAPMEEEIIPITQPPLFTAAPPPPAETPPVAEILDIVDNNEEIEEEKIESSEDTHEAISGPASDVPYQGPVVVGPPQAGNDESDEGEILTVAENMPEFPGGMEALMKYLSKNIKYPSSALDNNIQGRSVLTFVVNKDGSIVDIEVVKSLDAACDKEAIRVVKTMPKWQPGKMNGRPVRVKFTLPVTFRIS